MILTKMTKNLLLNIWEFFSKTMVRNIEVLAVALRNKD